MKRETKLGLVLGGIIALDMIYDLRETRIYYFNDPYRAYVDYAMFLPETLLSKTTNKFFPQVSYVSITEDHSKVFFCFALVANKEYASEISLFWPRNKIGALESRVHRREKVGKDEIEIDFNRDTIFGTELTGKVCYNY